METGLQAEDSHKRKKSKIMRIAALTVLVTTLAYGLQTATPARAGVFSQVLDGMLVVTLSTPERLRIACEGGEVGIGGQPPDNGAADCRLIREVVITGSPGADWIDLRELTPADFRSLGSLDVRGGEGNDRIYASPLPDQLNGGPGEDVYIGTTNDDQVDTSQGQDYFIEDTLPVGEPEARNRPGGPAAPEAPDSPVLEGDFGAVDFVTNAALNGNYLIPPDPIGAAGPNHVLNVVNTTVEWFTKDGTLENSQRLGRNSSGITGSFFESLNPANLLFDPKTIYDQQAGRFLVVALERVLPPGSTSRILLAVSDDSDPNGTWYFHAINSAVSIGGATWADYPGFAIDEDAVYITTNQFSFGGNIYQGSRLWIVNKTPFYSGGAASVTVHDPDTAAGGYGGTMQPAHVFGAAPGSIGTWLASYSGLSDGTNEYAFLIRVDNPLGTVSFTGSLVLLGNIDNTTIGNLPDAPQLGTSTLVEVNDRRALHAVWRDNRLWTTFEILPSSGGETGQVTAHWVAINATTVTSLADQGNAGGEDIATGTYTFFPSIAVDVCGNMGLGYAASAPTIYPGAYYSSRYDSDPAGTLQSSEVLKAGEDYYIRTFSGTSNRWGDYSGIALDPATEARFWLYNEYAMTRGTPTSGQDGRWATHWGSFASGIDFGDLPAGYSKTLAGNDGARHCISNLYLGAATDPEGDGQESATAQGDNDDGVANTGNWSDGDGNLLVTVSGGNACLSAWLDYWDGTTFGADSDFDDDGEQIFDRQAVTSGANALDFPLPFGAASGSPVFYGRFRLAPDLDADGDCSDQAAIDLTGLVSGGEVEDYEFNFTPTAVRLSKLETRTGENGMPWPILLGVGLLGFVGCVLLWRRLTTKY